MKSDHDFVYSVDLDCTFICGITLIKEFIVVCQFTFDPPPQENANVSTTTASTTSSGEKKPKKQVI